MDRDTLRFYALTAERTADEWYPNEVLMPIIRSYLSLLPAHPRVLDLGCGAGYESARLARAGAEVLGVDYSAESIRIARERCPECRFELLDFRELDDRFGRFDGAFASASLIHVAADEMPGVLDRVADVLTPQGLLLAIVRDGEGVWERELEIEGERIVRRIHRYTRDALLGHARRYTFMQEEELTAEYSEQRWRCYLLRLRD